MKILKHFIFSAAAIYFLGACSDEVNLSASANDFFNIKIDDAYFPVLVRGNTKAGTMLLYVQGGPGYPSIDYAQVDYARWKNSVEKDFAIAYYDQRGFGNKQGNSDLSTMTMAQYQRDIHYIAKFLKTKYAGTKVVLFAHSWGGSLSYHYMINYEQENQVDGLISICGPYTHDGDNVKTQRWEFRRSFLIHIADLFITKGIEVSYWEEAKEWALELDAIDTDEEMKQWNKHAQKAEKFTETEIGISDYVKVGFGSSYNIFSSLQYEYNDEVADKLMADEQRYDLSTSLNKIDKPTLIVAARYDDQAPAEELTFIFNEIGSTQKQFRLFNNSGHNVFLDEGEEFRKAVKEFCKTME